MIIYIEKTDRNNVRKIVKFFFISAQKISLGKKTYSARTLFAP